MGIGQSQPSNTENSDMKKEVLRSICKPTTKESVSILCFNDHHDCALCTKIKSHCEKEFGQQKMFMNRF